MSSGGSLINLGDISKPATVLIEKISEAVGGIAKPWQIKRVAQAESQADIIRSQTRITISEVEERALARMVREEGLKQENIENITAKALPLLDDDADPEKLEKDWISYFFDKCRLVSDEEMQDIWSHILAGQTNAPGSFSKSTIDIVSNMEKLDAELFAKFCTFTFYVGTLQPFLYSIKTNTLSKYGLNFVNVNHLQSIGLITLEQDGYRMDIREEHATISYYGKLMHLDVPSEPKFMNIGSVMLTNSGRQLAGICDSAPSSDYLVDIIERWMEFGYAISVPMVAAEGWKAW